MLPILRRQSLRLSCWLALLSAPFCPAAEGLSPEGLFNGARESAEVDSEFETDRDSFTPATSTVAAGELVVESAWSFIDNRDVPDGHSLPELLLRYGAGDWLELRFGSNYEVGGEAAAVSGGSFGEEVDETGGKIERSSTVAYGVKALISGQEGWLPESSLIVAGITPTSGRETATDVVVTYAWGWTFANDWKWDSSLRYGTGHAEGERYNHWAPSTVLKVPVGESWDVHAEFFSDCSDGRAVDVSKHYFSPGAAYMLTENVELGVRLGWGLNEDATKFFSNVGVGWRF